MTPGSIRARTAVLGAALLLALAGANARAGDLYQWETEDGRIEIGTNPPLGAAAKPWNPGQEAAARPTPPAAPAPAVTPVARPGAGHRSADERAKEARRRALGRLGDACVARKGAIAKGAQKIAAAENRITQLETRLEELEATALAYSRTSCRSDYDDGSDSSDCLASTFHRDAEIARTQEELEDTQQKLADLEQRTRAAEEDPSCGSEAAAPEK